jgi:pimeloyl-ACP methyl ester carboxylesterase
MAAVEQVGVPGGALAVELATAHPERVKSLVLVDGGFPMAAPPGLTRDNLPALFRDRMDRMDRDWASVNDYARFFVEHTAPMLDPGDPLLLDYLAHDLDGPRVRLSRAALVQDAADIFFGSSPWQRLQVPIQFLAAEWSTGPDSPPAYPQEELVRFAEAIQGSRTIQIPVPPLDHAAMIMSARGARHCATAIAKALS